MIYFAEVAGREYGGGYGIGKSSTDALTTAGRALGYTLSQARRLRHYVLQFPDGAEVSLGSELTGGWRASVRPSKLVERIKIPAETTDAQLMGLS
jgi:hypothetical protein